MGNTHHSFPNDLDGRIYSFIGSPIVFTSHGPNVLVLPIDIRPLY